MNRIVPAALLVAFLCACETAPIASIPDPLPEALPWTTSEELEEGAFLGIEGRENDSGSLDELSFDPGVRVTDVATGSPADMVGIQAGDVLMSFEGQELYAPEDIAALLRGLTGNEQVTCEVMRDDTMFEVQFALRPAAGGAGEVMELYRVDVARTRAAWATSPKGVVLVSSADGGPTERAGLAIGDVVLEIDGEPVVSDRGMVRRLLGYEAGTRHEFEVVHGKQLETMSVELYEPSTKTTHFVFPILWNWNADTSGDYAEFALIDLYFISLFRYRRDGDEKEWRFLRFFQVKSGVGELTE